MFRRRKSQWETSEPTEVVRRRPLQRLAERAKDTVAVWAGVRRSVGRSRRDTLSESLLMLGDELADAFSTRIGRLLLVGVCLHFSYRLLVG